MITIDEKEFHCPVELTLGIINDKSKIFIVYILLSGQKRFKDICEAFSQITQKTVTQKLKELEASHIIERTVFAEVPPRVEYALSPMGKELEKVLSSMHDFGESYAAKYGCTKNESCK